jgi:hypothetical protein
MSTGTRRLNYTQRQRLERRHVDITIRRPREGDPPEMSASIDLTSYSLPPDARVMIDAYRNTAWQRFEFGTVGAVQAPEDRLLREFGAGEGVHFRVKVVEPHSHGATAARILAQADGIKPKEDGPRRSLLPLDPDPSLTKEVWRLEIDENDGPLIKVSTHLVRDRQALARSPAFRSLVLPEVLRRVLTWALEDDLPGDDEDDWETPRGRWIRFGCGLLGQTEPPENLDDRDEGADARDAWIEQAVNRFCHSNRIDEVFGEWWRDDAPGAAGGAA